jgi:hypothetical protein
VTTLALAPQSQFLRRAALLALGLALSACSATPISIPGSPEGGIPAQDLGVAADSVRPDGLVIPDSGSVPADAAPSPDAAAPDSAASDGASDALVDGSGDGLTPDGVVVDGTGDGVLAGDAAGEAGAVSDSVGVGDAAGE